jgi:hypothetical protein
MYFTGGYTDENALLAGVCSRIGVVCCYLPGVPALDKHAERLPAIVTGVPIVALPFFVVRPKRFPLILAGVAITPVIHFGSRFAASRWT